MTYIAYSVDDLQSKTGQGFKMMSTAGNQAKGLTNALNKMEEDGWSFVPAIVESRGVHLLLFHRDGPPPADA